MESTNDKKAYEIAFLAKEEGDIAKISTLIKQHDGKIILDGQARKIALSYKINKETHAFFDFLHFEMDPESVNVLDHDLKANPGILRFLIITPPFIKAKPSVFAKPRIRTSSAKPASPVETATKTPLPLSNEALEKKIEEILQ